ncbi:lish domain-containing [Plakobranchus ocellatus]|uniref:Lish domain-containing n=1 Tax=Plakobranchus ocellatus TaxID=259542 RepID=A0AAV4CGX6_9GAST|nr:lish domain-containing [Plakobranchus ocellatus]
MVVVMGVVVTAGARVAAADQQENSEQDSKSNSVVASKSGSLCSTLLFSPSFQEDQRQPVSWERNKIERALNGDEEEYTGKDGEVTKSRNIKPGCGEKLPRNANISAEQREYLFHQFWGLRTIVEKKLLINKYVNRKENKTQTPNGSRRKNTICRGLPTDQNSGLTFFLHTLAINEQMVSIALDKHDEDPIIQVVNRGGNHIHQENEEKYIRNHTESFPVMDSPYCRKNTNRQYLRGHLNVSMMHRLYEESRLGVL